MDTPLSQRIELFMQTISCGYPVDYWELDPELRLVSTTCQNSATVFSFLLLDDCRDCLQTHIAAASGRPLVLTNALGMSWIAVFELAAQAVVRVHLIGPSFPTDVSYRKIEQTLARKKYAPEVVEGLQRQLSALPVIPFTVWIRLGLMFQFCVTGERLTISDFEYQTRQSPVAPRPQEQVGSMPQSNTWLAEQEAMRMIEEGRLDYTEALERLTVFQDSYPFDDGRTCGRNSKNAVISFITLATRAAIRGGVEPGTAYSVGMHYLESVEGCGNFPDLMQLTSTMFEDFVKRVHKARAADGTSAAIRACCDYIDMHLSERLTVRDLAAKVGYSEYYLAEKFKKEMGLSITDYAKRARVERAKVLLRSTNQSIQEIAEDLGFCNPSYFTSCFRSLTGTTPGEYRDKL